MNGLNRGSLSLIALLVINPMIILFYQNCSMPSLGQNVDSKFAIDYMTPQRMPASAPSYSMRHKMDLSLPKDERVHVCLAEYQTCLGSTSIHE